MGALYFVTGGARSGKSAFAQQLTQQASARNPAVRPLIYLATMQPLDDELERRVARHREVRGTAWRTLEEPLNLAGALAGVDSEACVLLDCLSLWVTNRLLPLGDPPAARDLEDLERALEVELAALIELQRRRAGALIVVSNEVGSGVVPPSALGRAYRDLLGRANQQVSATASRAWLLAAGRALELPSPFDVD